MAATTKKGISFRDTAGFVTDPLNCVWTDSTYPAGATIDGDSEAFGWVNGGGYGIPYLHSDLSAGGDPRLAGAAFIYFGASDPSAFRYDLVGGPGAYRIWLGLGDAIYGGNQGCKIYDNTTLLATISSAAAAGEFIDATGVLHASDAAWAASNASRLLSFASSICRIVLEAGGGNNSIAHFAIQKVGGGGNLAGDGTSGGLQ